MIIAPDGKTSVECFQVGVPGDVVEGTKEGAEKVRLVLADSHPLIREGLERLFAVQGGFEILASCSDGEEALAAVRCKKPDVLVIGLRMPGIEGIEVLHALRDDDLLTRVVVLAENLDEREALECLRLGVAGIVLKNMPSCLVLQCVQKVAAGDTWVERDSFSRAMEHLLRREAGTQRVVRKLTPRELEVVCLCAGGASNAEIANMLSLAEGTIKSHLHQAYRKLDVRDRIDLTRFAYENGLV